MKGNEITDEYIAGAMEMAITFVEVKLNIYSDVKLKAFSGEDAIGVINNKSPILAGVLWSLESSYKDSKQFNEELEAKGVIGDLSPQDSTTQPLR